MSIAICDGKSSNKIIGGTTVDIENYPYIVSIKWSNWHVCSGNLITSLHVLTAGSCLIFDNGRTVMSNLVITAGTNDKLDRFQLGQVRNVEYIIYHEEYTPQQLWKNDLAILKLEMSFNVNSVFTRIIGIRTSILNLVLHFKTAGWVCRNMFKSDIHLYQGCSKVVYPNQKITPGDGGNPLVINNQLVGHISATIGSGSTIIFTQLWGYSNWIQFVIFTF
ncbi:serine protease SP24D-like [Aphidius gifuensis]|uniref:serine protease SP24D-like n=1 Tax=Aphidius gifuensis TaxID=684658 RepID=UPI001CDD7872|nr:serine protease SP24D-like [Aphidius gifuensis]